MRGLLELAERWNWENALNSGETKRTKMSGDDLTFPFAFQGPTTGPEVYYGLTKRELFAALAMQGLCRIHPETYSFSKPEGRMIFDWYAEDAVLFADALIKELNKTNG